MSAQGLLRVARGIELRARGARAAGPPNQYRCCNMLLYIIARRRCTNTRLQACCTGLQHVQHVALGCNHVALGCNVLRWAATCCAGLQHVVLVATMLRCAETCSGRLQRIRKTAQGRNADGTREAHSASSEEQCRCASASFAFSPLRRTAATSYTHARTLTPMHAHTHVAAVAVRGAHRLDSNHAAVCGGRCSALCSAAQRSAGAPVKLGALSTRALELLPLPTRLVCERPGANGRTPRRESRRRCGKGPGADAAASRRRRLWPHARTHARTDACTLTHACTQARTQSHTHTHALDLGARGLEVGVLVHVRLRKLQPPHISSAPSRCGTDRRASVQHDALQRGVSADGAVRGDARRGLSR